MDNKGKGYEGRITNAGSQFVQAPHPQPKTPTTATETTGKDLRGRAGSK